MAGARAGVEEKIAQMEAGGHPGPAFAPPDPKGSKFYDKTDFGILF